MSLEETLAANTAALTRNSDLLERVVAGQEAAMAKLADGAAKPASRSRAAKPAAEEPAAGNAAPASTEAGATAAASAASDLTVAISPAAIALATSVAGITTDDEMKAFCMAWTGSTEDQAERQKRVELLKAIAQHLGVGMKFSELVPHKQQVVFFIERAKAGKAVDFNADYDFSGDPAQGGDAPATGSDDDFG